MTDDKRNISVYNALTNQDIDSNPPNLKTPVHNISVPKKTDYDLGYINRYFVKRINSDFAYETTKLDYDDVDLSMWQKVEIQWKLVGNRYTQNQILGLEPFNKSQISIASSTITEIRHLLIDPVQFARFY